MQTNDIKPKTQLKSKKLIGRGGKRGKTSGRGTKGQSARAGNKKRPEMRDIIKKLPKLRGYKFNTTQAQVTPVTFELIEKVYKASESVNPTTLAEKGVTSAQAHKLRLVKILNKGTLTKALSFEGCSMSAGARETILKAGGTIIDIPVKITRKEKGGTSGKPKEGSKKAAKKVTKKV
jgi:large subunit ribosomal protein L15